MASEISATKRKSCAEEDGVEAIAEATNPVATLSPMGLESQPKAAPATRHRYTGDADDDREDGDQSRSGQRDDPGVDEDFVVGQAARGQRGAQPEKMRAAAPRSNMRSMV